MCVLFLFFQLIIGPKGECPTMRGNSRIFPYSNWQKMSWRWRFPPNCYSQHIASWLQVELYVCLSLCLCMPCTCRQWHNKMRMRKCDREYSVLSLTLVLVCCCLCASILQRWNHSGRVTCQRRSCCVLSNIPVLCRNLNSIPRTNTLLNITSSRETNLLTTLSSSCRWIPNSAAALWFQELSYIKTGCFVRTILYGKKNDKKTLWQMNHETQVIVIYVLLIVIITVFFCFIFCVGGLIRWVINSVVTLS